MEQTEIENKFARASAQEAYMTPGERMQDGARNFKRRILGLCGSKTEKTLDELAQALQTSGIVDSINEGREFAQSLDGKKVSYASGRIAIYFDKVTNGKGDFKYRITTGCDDD